MVSNYNLLESMDSEFSFYMFHVPDSIRFMFLIRNDFSIFNFWAPTPSASKYVYALLQLASPECKEK